MRLWWLNAAILVGACGRFDFDPFGPPNDGRSATSDGSGNDAPLDGYSGSGCLSPGIGDTFDDEITPCNAWGQPVFDNTMIGVANGQLTITPNANAQSAGGCLRSTMPFTQAGFFVEIAQYPTIGELQLVITDLNTGTTWIIQSTDQVQFEFIKSTDATPLSIPFDASMLWWRLRPTANSVVYETSPDGATWTIQRTAAGAAPTNVGATFEDVVDDPAPGTAIIDGIDICP